jgi:hypothetical protein
MTESPPSATITPVRRHSALATSIARQNPRLAHLSDRELIVLHHRRVFADRINKLQAWASCETAGKARESEYSSRVESLRAFLIRAVRGDLMQLGMEITAAESIGVAITGDEQEFQSALASLSGSTPQLFTAA